jgi:hypothetical protein
MELYDRLTAKGKQKKLALIAVSNKLLRQAFAIVKNKTEYDECFFIKKKCRITQFFAKAKPEATEFTSSAKPIQKVCTAWIASRFVPRGSYDEQGFEVLFYAEV